ERGAIFVEEETEVPEGETVIFSAHGVAPSVHANARERRLDTIDATCPLVTKVHVEARRYAAEGYEIALIGHEGHEEVVGTTGEAPDAIVLVQTVEDAERVEFADAERVAYITQTTLSVDDTREIIAVLKRRFPAIHGPDTKTICYATQNRQLAVRVIARRAERLIVCGARNSSNTNRLCEVAASEGRPALLMQDPGDLTLSFIDGAAVIGITAGASAPEALVQEALVQLARWRRVSVEEVCVTEEGTRFAPVDLSRIVPWLADAS
ncbi:MAG TPA: 4-hydroxy-3-methylbut-2-enyl diphosphate reductase, partial [Solirubrobacterales bacterium]|nr:4-hydroxy-3-methylbut-2-enyl diphosphate reductase [Solirubrobacterales bacterium]